MNDGDGVLSAARSVLLVEGGFMGWGDTGDASDSVDASDGTGARTKPRNNTSFVATDTGGGALYITGS